MSFTVFKKNCILKCNVHTLSVVLGQYYVEETFSNRPAALTNRALSPMKRSYTMISKLYTPSITFMKGLRWLQRFPNLALKTMEKRETLGFCILRPKTIIAHEVDKLYLSCFEEMSRRTQSTHSKNFAGRRQSCCRDTFAINLRINGPPLFVHIERLERER